MRKRLATKYNPNQHSRSKRVEKLHRLKSHPISLEAFRTEQREPFDFPTGISGFPKYVTSTPGLTSADRALLRVNARVLTGFSRQGPLPETARGLFPSVFPG